jgi:hypothetical protein
MDGGTGPPLSDGEARVMEAWVVAANSWGEAAQAAVGAATELATASRELADRFKGTAPADGIGIGNGDRAALAKSLRQLGDAVERETRELRDGYLATASNLEQYRGLLG